MTTKKRKAHFEDLEDVHPSEKDEPPFTCRLYFSSYSVFVDLSGWSSLIPIKLGEVNLRSTTRFADLFDQTSRKMHAVAKDWLEAMPLDTIRNASNYIGLNNNVTALLMVQVIAKRQVAVVDKNNRIFLIPTLIVADRSGYCMFTSMNEGVKVVYNSLDIGDVVLLTRFQPLAPLKPVHKGLFPDKHFVNLEIKIAFHSARHHYHLRFDTERETISPFFKISEDLFDDNFRFFLPDDLQNISLENKSNLDSYFFDLVGVINYVGRTERHRVASPITVESIDRNFIHVPKFAMYRWIKIIGKTGESIPIKLYISNQTLEYQSSIIPGAHVVISNCIVKEDQFSLWRHIALSEFSHIFVGQKIQTYFRTRPLFLWEKAKSILGRQGYISVLSRTDIQFSIGGSIHAERIVEPKFLTMYKSKERILYNEIDNRMKRREARTLFIKGKIIRAFSVTRMKNCRNVKEYIQVYSDSQHTGNTSDVNASFLKKYHPIVNTWYSFIRLLPQLNPDILLETKSSIICSRITEEYGKYCGPLLMPTTTTAWGNFDRLADLPCIDGQSYIEVDIFNEQSSTEWRCIWKYTGTSIHERINKIKSSASKTVICLVQAFCLEPDSTLELTLVDFASFN